jgi:hypothetical protein
MTNTTFGLGGKELAAFNNRGQVAKAAKVNPVVFRKFRREIFMLMVWPFLKSNVQFIFFQFCVF